MKISDIRFAAATARKTKNEILTSQLARGLADLFDRKNVTFISSLCTKLVNEEGYVARLENVRSWLPWGNLLIIFGMIAFLPARNVGKCVGISSLIFLVYSAVCLLINKKIGKLTEAYNTMATKVFAFSTCLSEVKTEFDVFAPKNAGHISIAIGQVFFKIVCAERNGLKDGDRLVNPFPKKGAEGETLSLKNLKDFGRRLVIEAAEFGIGNGDLAPLFAAAEAEWEFQVRSGYIHADYQI